MNGSGVIDCSRPNTALGGGYKKPVSCVRNIGTCVRPEAASRSRVKMGMAALGSRIFSSGCVSG